MAKFGFGRSKKNGSKVEAAQEPQLLDIDVPVSGSHESTKLEAPQPYLHLLRQVKNRPDAIALASPDGDFTFRQVFEISKRIAAVMRKRGIRPGQVVATSVNVHENFLFMMAIFHEAAIGGIAPAKLNETLTNSIDWLIAVEPREGFPLSKTILIDQAFQTDFEGSSTISDPIPYPSFDSYCRLIFSSGTTGYPKAVPFTVAMVEARNEYSREAWMNIQPFMSMIGMSGISGFATAYAAPVSGQPYFSPGDEKENLNLIHRHQVASFKCSPRQMAVLTELIRQEPEKAASLKSAMTVGSELPFEIGANFQRVAHCEVTNGLGSTEAGLITRRNYLSETPSDMGPLVEGATVEIVDENGNQLPLGEIGEMRWHREHMATEYFKNPTDSAVNFRDGWFYPGDTGYFGENGHLFLAGRQSELINIGGVKLNPSVVDRFVNDFPGIQDVVSFAFRNQSGVSDFGMAVVVPKDFNRQGLIDALRNEYRGAVPTYVISVPAIKRNALGKPMRAEHAKDLEALLAKQAKR